MQSYDIAQICLNGHIINHAFKNRPENNRDHCTECGSKTIINCQYCEEKIVGGYINYTEQIFHLDKIPKFCHKCGKPYPWIENKMNEVKELMEELESLNEDEKEKFKNSLDDLIKDKNINLASFRFKKIATKIGESSYKVIKNIVIDIISETAKKTIWPGS